MALRASAKVAKAVVIDGFIFQAAPEGLNKGVVVAIAWKRPDHTGPGAAGKRPWRTVRWTSSQHPLSADPFNNAKDAREVGLLIEGGPIPGQLWEQFAVSAAAVEV
jgi:hypothetical protein